MPKQSNHSTSSGPLVTVCMTAYNHENFIEESLQSVLTQSDVNVHVIVANDASTDNTAKIIHDVEKKYKGKINFINHQKNLGIMGNMASIYKQIPEETTYITWFSGDDVMLPNKLSKQIEFMEQNPQYVMCYHDGLIRDDVNDTEYRFYDFWHGEKTYVGNIADKIVKYGTCMYGMSALSRYDKIKHIHHRTDVGPYNDWVYLIELANVGLIGRLKDVLIMYRRHGGNFTQVQIPNPQWTVQVLEFTRTQYPNLETAVQWAFLKYHLSFAWQYWGNQKKSNAKTHLAQILKMVFSNVSLIYPLISYTMGFIIKRTALYLKLGMSFREKG